MRIKQYALLGSMDRNRRNFSPIFVSEFKLLRVAVVENYDYYIVVGTDETGVLRTKMSYCETVKTLEIFVR